jgi:hypothetical protein
MTARSTDGHPGDVQAVRDECHRAIDAMVGVSDEVKAEMKSMINRNSFPTVEVDGFTVVAGVGREDIMAVVTAIPVPSPAPKKVGLTIKCPSVPVMQSPVSGDDKPLVLQVAAADELEAKWNWACVVADMVGAAPMAPPLLDAPAGASSSSSPDVDYSCPYGCTDWCNHHTGTEMCLCAGCCAVCDS